MQANRERIGEMRFKQELITAKMEFRWKRKAKRRAEKVRGEKGEALTGLIQDIGGI